MWVRATVGNPQRSLSAGPHSRYHTGSTISNQRIIGYIMTNPLTPHKGTGEKKPWAKYIQAPQKNSPYKGRFNLPVPASTFIAPHDALCNILSVGHV